MSGREAILGRVSAALEGREATEHPGDFGEWRPSPLQGAPVDGFVVMFEAAGGEVKRFETGPEASAWVRSFVADFESVSVGTLARWPLHHGANPNERIEAVDPAEAGVGVSLAYGAVAETGSLIMIPQDGRRAQLLPPVHVVFVDEAKIFATLREALVALRGDGLPSALGLHSGPSKSADIGQVLVKGVHGPGRVVAVVVP